MLRGGGEFSLGRLVARPPSRPQGNQTKQLQNMLPTFMQNPQNPYQQETKSASHQKPFMKAHQQANKTQPTKNIDVDSLLGSWNRWKWSVDETSKDVTGQSRSVFAVEIVISATQGKNDHYSSIMRVKVDFGFFSSGMDPGGYCTDAKMPTMDIYSNPSSTIKFLSLVDARQNCPGLLEQAFAKCLHDISRLVFAQNRNIEAVGISKSVMEGWNASDKIGTVAATYSLDRSKLIDAMRYAGFKENKASETHLIMKPDDIIKVHRRQQPQQQQL